MTEKELISRLLDAERIIKLVYGYMKDKRLSESPINSAIIYEVECQDYLERHGLDE